MYSLAFNFVVLHIYKILIIISTRFYNRFKMLVLRKLHTIFGGAPKLSLRDPRQISVGSRFNKVLARNHAYLIMQNFGVTIKPL